MIRRLRSGRRPSDKEVIDLYRSIVRELPDSHPDASRSRAQACGFVAFVFDLWPGEVRQITAALGELRP